MNNRYKRPTLGAMTLAALLTGSPTYANDSFEERIDRHVEEFRTYPLIQQLSVRHQPETFAIVDVTVVTMNGSRQLIPNQTVIVEDSVIRSLATTGSIHIPENARIIKPGKGSWLIPGLTEMHAHTQFSLSQYLVYLSQGITAVREMDGFAWMLRAREQAAENALLFPNLYVSGHILSNRAWSFYMTQVDSAEEARARVREQAAAGYDFIKIHNSMPEPLFSALMDEATRHGLDVVGHIPNEISIAQAIDGGMRTNEHFKGYIFDEDLSITQQDYVEDTRGSEMWHAPSFANYHEHLRGEAAYAQVRKDNSLRLVPQWLRQQWDLQAAQPEDALTQLRQSILPKSKSIFSHISKVTDHFIAGTDTGVYAFQVPGYTLQEEVRIFESLGMTALEALATATINSALAIRRESEMGSIEPGKRADLVLLSRNPVDSAANLAAIEGVSVRGAWLNRDALDAIESQLESIFSDQASWRGNSTLEKLNYLSEALRTTQASEFPLPSYLLTDVQDLLNEPQARAAMSNNHSGSSP